MKTNYFTGVNKNEQNTEEKYKNMTPRTLKSEMKKMDKYQKKIDVRTDGGIKERANICREILTASKVLIAREKEALRKKTKGTDYIQNLQEKGYLVITTFDEMDKHAKIEKVKIARGDSVDLSYLSKIVEAIAPNHTNWVYENKKQIPENYIRNIARKIYNNGYTVEESDEAQKNYNYISDMFDMLETEKAEISGEEIEAATETAETFTAEIIDEPESENQPELESIRQELESIRAEFYEKYNKMTNKKIREQIKAIEKINIDVSEQGRDRRREELSITKGILAERKRANRIKNAYLVIKTEGAEIAKLEKVSLKKAIEKNGRENIDLEKIAEALEPDFTNWIYCETPQSAAAYMKSEKSRLEDTGYIVEISTEAQRKYDFMIDGMKPETVTENQFRLFDEFYEKAEAKPEAKMINETKIEYDTTLIKSKCEMYIIEITKQNLSKYTATAYLSGTKEIYGEAYVPHKTHWFDIGTYKNYKNALKYSLKRMRDSGYRSDFYPYKTEQVNGTNWPTEIPQSVETETAKPEEGIDKIQKLAENTQSINETKPITEKINENEVLTMENNKYEIIGVNYERFNENPTIIRIEGRTKEAFQKVYAHGKKLWKNRDCSKYIIGLIYNGNIVNYARPDRYNFEIAVKEFSKEKITDDFTDWNYENGPYPYNGFKTQNANNEISEVSAEDVRKYHKENCKDYQILISEQLLLTGCAPLKEIRNENEETQSSEELTPNADITDETETATQKTESEIIQATETLKREYHAINENQARQSKSMWSSNDYKDGIETERYKIIVDEVYEIGETAIKEGADEEKVKYYCDRFSKQYADWINKNLEIDSMCPSVRICGIGKFPIRKKEKQNAARDRHFKVYDKIMSAKNKLKGLPRNQHQSAAQAGIENTEPEYKKFKGLHVQNKKDSLNY